MYRTFVSSLAAMAVMAISVQAYEDETPGQFFARYGANPTYSNSVNSKQEVARSIASQVNSRLGPQWVEPALKIAKIESGYTCNVKGPKTRHGRAVGPLQVLVGSAESLGITAYELDNSCAMQIEAGIRHMERCIKLGAKTSSQFASCHVSGNPFNGRLTRKAERYRQKYIKLAVNAKIPEWVGTLYYW